MSTSASSGPRQRSSPFTRDPLSPSPSPLITNSRPKSLIFNSPTGAATFGGHSRNQSFSPLSGSNLVPVQSTRPRSSSNRSNNQASNTFAPSFIKAAELQEDSDRVGEIEGENDFSGKRYVWLRDPQSAFTKGWVVQEFSNGRLLVECDDGSQREVEAESVDKVNPAKFDKADDMAELTHLNEPSVVHNLHMRYQADLIYTYSGLFLVTVNPYCPLPIYTNEYMKMYKGRSREDTKPHIYAMADCAFRNLVEEGENQSILVTGESGAGKTENTKKVIQYLAAVATSNSIGLRSGARQFSNLSQQILRANPILEAFGNAQTVRNNNSSRFGKFIRIEFTRSGQIAGAFIDWYLMEKSRVVKLNSSERNYHVFYQFLKGADRRMKEEFLVGGLGVEDFTYTRDGNHIIAGVSDTDEWRYLIEAFQVMGFSNEEQKSVIRTVAAVLLLGNVTIMKESLRADQASLTKEAYTHAEKFCRLLGIPLDQFIQGLLHPKVKAGREWVEKVQTPEQVRSSLDALSKGIYERAFGDLVTRINHQLDRTGMGLDDSHFIGVLDIAGFEIFEENSFEQLCINYTNEKLQQFFNHHMFVLEQEEYAREQIEWKFIDFGKDLQPTIDLIELPNPIGIFSCLDEDSVMPKATDKSFTDKMHSLWDRKTPKYKASRLAQGFVLIHYAAEVEYSTSGWLEKNKDPLNDNVTRLLASSKDKHVAGLFADCNDLEDDNGAVRSRVKKGLFRTVAQRHKEQLASLMNQLHSTHPHFVRCILPNHKKRPKQFSAPLVLDQLRCNGVLEGIRIARTGFPNRLPFSEFRQRYEVLCHNMPKGYLNGKTAAQIMLERLELDKALYRVGLTKVFFRAGVLAELEERRDSLIRDIMSRFQSVARGFTQRRIVNKRLYRAEATRIIWHNLQVYVDLCNNPWWRLFVRMKPLLGATTSAGEVKKRDERIQKLETKMQKDNTERQKLEDERRRAHTEVQRIQKTLENERSLALDKEEIFKRLQHRESELSEKLAEASRTIGEIKKRDDMIQRLELKLHHESLGKKNLEDMLGQRDTEIQQLRQFSESQRSRALDEEETFQRFQRREAELTQQIGESERSFAIEKKEACQRLQQREAELSKKLADSERSFALEKAGILKQSQRREDELAEKLRESEHSLVLIKEEAFKQLQHREAELSEKLAGALEDQETLEDQLDELMNAKRKTEADLTSSLNLYKRRADEYFSKLEQAEIAVLKATRAEQTAKAQAQESGDTCLNIVAERKQMDVLVEDLQRQNQQYEAKVEDLAADLEGALQAKKRLQHELEDYRSQRATDIEDKETLMEQTRKKYQNEFLALTKELQVERENVIHARSENTRIRDELEELRSRCHDEVLNSSTWAKEKSRLELTLQDLSSSREEAVNAHNDAQARIVSLLSQLRNLRTSMDDVAAERDMLQKEKRGLETRLSEAGDRLEDLARGESPSRHNGAGMNRELLDLKSQLAQQEDVTAAAVDKMRRAETLATEMQKDVVAEREINATLHKEKAALEKTVKDLHGRVVDLETKGYSSTSQDVRFLNGRVQELEHQIEAHESKHATSLRSVRNIDRTVRDLQAQISRRDKQAQQLTNDIAKGRDKIDRLLQTVDELQAEEAQSQLAARRAERDLREEREKALRLERELEGWKGLRMERGGGKIGSGGDWSGSLRGAVSGNEWGGGGIFRTSTSTNGFCNGGKIGSAHLSGNSASAGAGAAPKSGVAERRMSDSKGFL